MKPVMSFRPILSALLLVAALLFLGAACAQSVSAQSDRIEVTPEPDAPIVVNEVMNDVMGESTLLDEDVPDPINDPPVSETPEPALEALLTLAASVAFGVEFIKKVFLSTILDNSTLSEEARAAIIQAIAFVLAFILVTSTEGDLNILAVLGIYPDASPLIAQLITAAAVSGGNMVLWSIYRFFKGPTGAAPLRAR